MNQRNRITPRIRLIAPVALLAGLSGWQSLAGQQKTTPDPLQPSVAAASDEGQQALAGMRWPKDLEGRLWAAEPLVANPVAFYVDFSGRMYVCESFRQERGVEDNRSHPEWLLEDLAAQSVADREAYMRRHAGDRAGQYTEQDDRIRLLTDNDGDGRADHSQVFADRFNQLASGTGAGVLTVDDRVWFTCIPDLWLLQDTDGDGRSDHRESHYNGFGVRFAFRGHDMHGLVRGPDGRVYFSIGDRGYHISDEISDPASGAVFRCEPDGSGLEVVATGLRNPQELAFDNYGNLFTGDNNSDSGDQARWVFVVPGGDSGWRMHYQYLPDRGPFNREKIWHPWNPDTPAYIVPPVANIADGPSGLDFYPGTGLGDFFENRFVLCDFRGAAGVSGIRSFRNKPLGAFWEVVDMDETIWGTLPTDVQFGPDGRLYISDWVHGWVGENKGRVYTFHDPQHLDSPLVRETEELLAGKIADQTDPRLGGLLGHADRRVRQEAQFELVRRESTDLLVSVAKGPQAGQLARLHAIWGLGQLARQGKYGRPLDRRQANPRPDASSRASEYPGWPLHDLAIQDLEDVELRAHGATLLADLGEPESASTLAGLLQDPHPRVRYFASMGLARIGTPEQIPDLLGVLIENNDQDPVVRHGGIMGLAGIASRWPEARGTLVQCAGHPEYPVRIAAVVALRKGADPAVAEFLHDPDPRVIVEAARAIHDLPLPEAMGDLADLIDAATFPDPLVRRVINANRRIGGPDQAAALAEFAACQEAPEERRLEALEYLANWNEEARLDAVTGEWFPLPARPPEQAITALESRFDRLMAATGPVRNKAVEVAGRLATPASGPVLAELVVDPAAPASLRATALRGLDRMDHASLKELIPQMLDRLEQKTLPPVLASAVLEIALQRNPQRAIPLLQDRLVQPDTAIGELRHAILQTERLAPPQAAELLTLLFERLGQGQLPPEVRLDLVTLARRNDQAAVQALAEQYQRSLVDEDDPLAEWQDTLVGGDPRAGMQVFMEKTEVSCVRCHRVGEIGGQVGPDLSRLGEEKDRRHILESMLLPNRNITEGYAQTVVLTEDGKLHTGLVKSENDTVLTLVDAEGNTRQIDVATIEERKPGLSSMPEDLMQKLTPLEVRDLIEYLKNPLRPHDY